MLDAGVKTLFHTMMGKKKIKILDNQTIAISVMLPS